MSDAFDRYSRISQGFEDRLSGIGDDQWTAATPCPDWNVRDLVAHLIGSHHLMLSTMGQTHATPGEGDDLTSAWREARQAVIDALADDTTAQTTVESPFGAMAFADLAGGLLCGDTLFHTWDLARATGQDETLDAHDCEVQLSMMQPVDGLIRSPGFFGPKLEAPKGADAQSRLLAFGGRRP